MIQRERFCVISIRERVCDKEIKVVCYQYERERVCDKERKVVC